VSASHRHALSSVDMETTQIWAVCLPRLHETAEKRHLWEVEVTARDWSTKTNLRV